MMRILAILMEIELERFFTVKWMQMHIEEKAHAS